MDKQSRGCCRFYPHTLQGATTEESKQTLTEPGKWAHARRGRTTAVGSRGPDLVWGPWGYQVERWHVLSIKRMMAHRDIV